MGNYEADVEAALASIKLAQSAEKQRQKLAWTESLIAFFEKHPEFKEFYDLVKKVDGY